MNTNSPAVVAPKRRMAPKPALTKVRMMSASRGTGASPKTTLAATDPCPSANTASMATITTPLAKVTVAIQSDPAAALRSHLAQHTQEDQERNGRESEHDHAEHDHPLISAVEEVVPPLPVRRVAVGRVRGHHEPDDEQHDEHECGDSSREQPAASGSGRCRGGSCRRCHALPFHSDPSLGGSATPNHLLRDPARGRTGVTAQPSLSLRRAPVAPTGSTRCRAQRVAGRSSP